MKQNGVLVLMFVLPLASCGSKTSVNERNASVEQVTNDIRGVSRSEGIIRPGKWQSTVTIEDMTMPNMPPQAAAQMKKMMSVGHTTETCLTPEEAKKPAPDFFAGNDKCRYDHFTMGGGKIDAEMHCSAGGGTQVMKMNATFSSDAYSMHMTSQSKGGSAAENVSMQMKVDSKRVGDCTAKTD